LTLRLSRAQKLLGLAMQIEERNYLLFTYLYFFIAIKLKV